MDKLLRSWAKEMAADAEVIAPQLVVQDHHLIRPMSGLLRETRGGVRRLLYGTVGPVFDGCMWLIDAALEGLEKIGKAIFARVTTAGRHLNCR